MKLRYAMLLSAGIAVMAAPSYAQSTAPATAADTAQSDDDDVIVNGIRRSLEDSIATKRRADSIVDVVSAEDIGKFPDRNIADTLARIPGITINRQFGEGEQVTINGMEPALNRILVDGHSIASADWGGSVSDQSSRSFNYSLMTPGIVSQAIVYKTAEARIQEGAIGGTIDIVTRKPLDLKPNTFTVTGGADYNARSRMAGARGSALYSWRNDAGTFGAFGAVGYDRVQINRAGVAVYWYRTGQALLDNAPTTATVNGKAIGSLTAAERSAFGNARYASFLAREFFRQARERLSFSGAVSIKPTDDLTLTATGLVIRGDYDNLSMSQYTYGYEGSRLIAAEYKGDQVTSASFGAGVAGAPGVERSGSIDNNFRQSKLKNDNVALLYEWTPGDWSIAGNAGYTRATGGRLDPEFQTGFHTYQAFSHGVNAQNTFANWAQPSVDGSAWSNQCTPQPISDERVVAANGGRPYAGCYIGGYGESGQTLDSEKFGQADFKTPIQVGPLTDILFGVRYSDHANRNRTYGSSALIATSATLAQIGDIVIDSRYFNGLNVSGNGLPFRTLSEKAIKAYMTQAGSLRSRRDEDLNSHWNVDERVISPYAQGNFVLGKLRGNVGVRFVSTRDRSQFYVGGTDNSGRTIPLTLVNLSKTDNRFLPAANLIFDAGEDVILRASAAKVIARPRYSDLAASLSLDDRTGTGGGGNFELDPYSATNYSGSAEWYFGRNSFVGAEIFHRDISNYISNELQEGPDGQGITLTNPITNVTRRYVINRPVNGGKATVTGFSIQSVADIWNGFGIQANYTFASAETSLANGLPQLSRNTVTFTPFYQKGAFQARVSYNRRSKYFRGFGRQKSQDYAAPYEQLDFSATYSLSRNIDISVTGANLLDETYYEYSTDPRFPSGIYKNGRSFSLTATFRM